MRIGGIVFSILISILLAGAGVSTATVNALSDPWIEDPPIVISKNPLLDALSGQSQALQCQGEVMPIFVVGSGNFQGACVFGGTANQVRLASFYSGSTTLYAISFPEVKNFYELRGACAFHKCAYSAERDVFVDRQNITPTQFGAVIYKSFVSNLIKKFDSAKFTDYFSFEPGQPDYTMKAGNRWLAAEAVALSQNGRWAVVELKGYGFVRFDAYTFDTKRIVSQTGTYGIFSDPVYELTISNDGRYLAYTNRGLAFWMVSVQDTCGDRLTQETEVGYAWNIIPCTTIAVDPARQFPGFTRLSKLRFDALGTRLGITVQYATGNTERIIYGPAASTHSSSIDYLALGDSFTSGEGEVSDAFYQPDSRTSPFKCHVSSRSYPYRVAANQAIRAKSVACSGARTADILGGNKYAGQADALLQLGSVQRTNELESALGSFKAGVLPQLEFVSMYQPRTVSVGIGGNDAGLVAKLSACVGVGECEWAKDPQKRYATAKEIAAVYPKLEETLMGIQAASPASNILLMGYPQVIDISTPASRCGLVLNALLSEEEKVFVSESIKYLNQVLKAVAQARAVTFVDIERSLKGHELCGSQSTKAMNAVRLGDDIGVIPFLPEVYLVGAESFHPTYVGHQRMADTLLGQFPLQPLANSCTTQCESVAAPEPSSYWRQGIVDESKVLRQINNDTFTTSLLHHGETIAIKSNTYMQFEPGYKVTIELHSQPKIVGEAFPDADGIIEQEVTIPKDTPIGTHTLHLIGASYTGEKIDVYKTVSVVDENFVRNTPVYEAYGSEVGTPSTQAAPYNPSSYDAVSPVGAINPLPALDTAGILGAIQPNVSRDLRTDTLEKSGVTLQWVQRIAVVVVLVGIIGWIVYYLVSRKRRR